MQFPSLLYSFIDFHRIQGLEEIHIRGDDKTHSKVVDTRLEASKTVSTTKGRDD